MQLGVKILGALGFGRWALWTMALTLLAACSPSTPPDVSKFPPPEWRGVKIGNPYKINGKWYSPHHNPNYDETGIASWYGPNFHGKPTANGERYDQHGYTAAHTTLPLPSIVRVTNLENGRAMNVRVNDRGPFHDNRIIDLSRSVAEKLGVIGSGVAKVRVQYLPLQSRIYVESEGQHGDELEYASGFTEYEVMQTRPIMAAPVPEIAVRDVVATAMIAPPLSSEPAAQQPVTVAAREPIRLPIAHPTADNWHIQVASYADKSNADLMLSKLSAIGRPWMQEVIAQGRSYYRLLLKPASTNISALHLLRQVQNEFNVSDARIIIR